MINIDSQTRKKDIEAIYPLSPMQQGILFHTLYAPESHAFFEQLVLKIFGQLDAVVFERAWQQVVERHSVLRTLFVWENSKKPLQIVLKQVKLPWINLDWRSLSFSEQQASLDSLLQTDLDRGFDFKKAPLMRCTLIQLDSNTYQLLWSHHHLLIDGWCLSLILTEVLDFYQSLKKEESSHLPPPRPYRDYIVWLQQQDLPNAEKFWRNELKGFTAPTPLPGSRCEISDFRQKQDYRQQSCHLSVTVTETLQSLARQYHLTLSTLVQGAWAILLSCYSGESEVIFGSLVSGRPPNLVGVESMVGVFFNTLPVRVQISPEISLTSWLKQLQDKYIELQHYAYTPLVEIQQWSEVSKKVPLFESVVVFHNYPVDSRLWEENSGLEISLLKSFDQSDYPLTLTIGQEKQLLIQIEYYNSHFEDDTITLMLGHLQTVLEAMAANLQQSVSQLSLLTAKERHQILVEWNKTQRDYPQGKCIHQLFEEQVKKTPDAIAVIFENQQLTYQELNARANQLAHYLQNLGVEPEVLVGICTERSLEMVIGLLGILKAGGAYVPLDPTYPQERLAYMIGDSQVPVLLTQEKLVKHLPQHQAQVICLDSNWETIGSETQENPVTEVNPENLAYVIYTSGSTGKPKGAMNTHLGLVNRLLWMQEAYQLTASDRVLQKTPFSFDVSVWEFFWPLITGAQLVVAKPGGHQDSAYLVNLIAQEQITTLHFVPSMLQIFLEDKELEKCASLRQVICSGEALPFDLQERFFERLDHCELHNLYGPTEAAIDVTFYKCQQGNHQKIVPIGRPIANTQMYILDPNLQPVPLGVKGELHIGGVQLARGYLNRPELTQQKFIPNPYSDEADTKLYKTGDLARYLLDGNIEYLGRIDHQVKIRGFRIELGEIEAVLSQHPQVREAVVLVTEDQPGNKRLVAYLVTNQEPMNLGELRQFLAEKLPDYMVPSAFAHLEAMPLTPNGKVDRKALLKIDLQHSVSDSELLAPRDNVELALARIWSEVLGVFPVGIQHDFFELGGHSLIAMRLITEIQTQFQVQLPLTTLFENPTVEKLAGILRQQTPTATDVTLVPIQTNGSQPPLFFIHPGGGYVTCYYDLSNELGTDQPVYGLQAVGLDGEMEPDSSIEAMATRYREAIYKIQPQGPYHILGWSLGGLIAFELAQQFLKHHQSVAFLGIIDTKAPSLIPATALEDTELLVGFFNEIARVQQKAAEITVEEMGNLSTEQQLQYFLDRSRQSKLIPADWDLERIRALLKVYQCHAQAMHVYQAVPYPNSLTIFRAAEEPLNSGSDPALGWTSLASGGIEVYEMLGNHQTMIYQPHARILGEQLRACLQRLIIP